MHVNTGISLLVVLLPDNIFMILPSSCQDIRRGRKCIDRGSDKYAPPSDSTKYSFAGGGVCMLRNYTRNAIMFAWQNNDEMYV